jgi:anaerobic magnesium-protoporphyrin IX monomethyl ester cyclase
MELNSGKGKKITLIEWRPSKSIYKWVSLGLQYVAAALREDGFSAVEIVLFEGEEPHKCSERIINRQTEILGVQFFRETESEIITVIKDVKRVNPQLTVIAGGHTATLYAARLLKKYPEIDIIVCGEAELTIVELCSRLGNGGRLEGCRGIFFRENKLFYKNPPRDLIADLDQLPLPAMDPIIDRLDASDACVFLSIATSRGCLGDCEFCVEHRGVKGENALRWRGRSPESVIRELEVYQGRFSGKRLVVKFIDGAFEDPDPIEKKRLKEMISLIKERKTALAYSFLTRAESWSGEDMELLKDLKATGLYSAAIGLENGAGSSLQKFAKRATVRDNLRACQLFAANRIGYYGFFIMFHPYATLDDLNSNAEFLLQINLAYRPDVWFHDLYVYPDTRFFQRIAKDSLLLGAEESGFHYLYAFEDGRVASLYQVAAAIKRLDSYVDFVVAYDRIILELSLYEVWKNYFEAFRKVNSFMEESAARIRLLLNETGICQSELFRQLTAAAASHSLAGSSPTIIRAWDQLLREKLRKLEGERMIYRMRLARKNLRIV